MHDDLNVAAAIGELNRWTSELASPGAAEAGALRDVDGVLGVLELERPAAAQSDIGVFAAGVEANSAIETKLRERRDARAARDFRRSDAIRDELATMGYAIKDLPGGKVEVRRA
jgi:cysteinyl-tRNA synthetase